MCDSSVTLVAFSFVVWLFFPALKAVSLCDSTTYYVFFNILFLFFAVDEFGNQAI